MKKTSTLRWSCSVMLLFSAVTTFAQFPFTETFRNATAPGMVYGNQVASMTPFLTASNGTDPVGSGYLRLTNNSKYQAGYAYNDVNVFPSYYGLDATFEYSQYGGTGADGITFFLFDASTNPFQIGGWGGSLGYANWNAQPGMTGGYIDIGLDKYGNFSNAGENRITGRVPNQLYPGSVVIRGPQSLNWNYIDGKQTNSELGADNFVLCGSARASGLSDPNYRKVRIRLQPRVSPLTGYNIIVDITIGGVSPKTINVLTDIISTPAPSFLKFGYSGSTGESTDFHEIRNLSVDAEPTGAALLVNPTANDILASTTCDNSKLIVATTNVMAHCSSNNHDGYILPSLIDLDPATAGIQNTFTATGKGTFTVDVSGIVTFTPVNNYTGGSAVCSYQVTDNYGKKSNTAQISFNAKPTEFAYTTSPSTTSQPLSSNSFNFIAYGNSAGETYSWDFGDGTGSTSATPTKSYSAIGIYNAKLITTNLQGCSATTYQTVLVTPASKAMDVIPDCNLSSASKITQTVVFERSTTDWASSNLKTKNFAKFDTTLGILLGVKIVNNGSFTTNNKVEITGNMAAGTKELVTMSTTGTMDFYAPGFLYGITPPTIIDSFSSTGFDGVKDFAGTSGKDFGPHTSAKSDSTIFTTSGTMAQYMGKDSVSLIVYTNTSSSWILPTGNDTAVISTTATDTATIVYYYCPSSGGVSGGGGGGLESKDLGDAIVKRIYTKAINSLQQPVDYSVMTPVGETAARATTMGFGSNSKLTLSDILQQKFSKYNFTSYISTPTDIPSITNATDVLSIDYTLNNQAKAVSFGTQTSNAVYDHTKAICDRLKGSVLTGMQNVVVNNMNMIAYTLKDADGSTEYAMSFVIGAKTGRNNYTLQSNWLNQDYTADETMYNIQLWAVSPTMVTDMATEIISNLQSNMPVQYISAKKLPDTYITSGSRDKTDLVLSVTNNQTNGNGYFVVEDKSNELSTTTKRTIPFAVAANGKGSITIPMSDIYASTISMYINNQLQDVVYMADGTWSYGAGPATTVSSFAITNDTNKTYLSDELPVFRNVQVNANGSDYVSVFKLLKGGGVAQDLTSYKTLRLTASGGYNLRITLVKNSIANWSDQYSTLIPLNKEAKDYYVSMDAFVSAATKDKISANDVTTVVFSIEVGTGQTSVINTTLNSISFAKQTVSYLESLSAKEVLVYPNPATGNKFTCSFMSDKSAQLTLRVIELTTGKVLQSQQVAAVTGQNTVQVDINRSNAGSSVYLIALDGDNVQYKKAKVVVGNQ